MFLFNLLDGWLAPYGSRILRTLGVQLPQDWKAVPGFGILATFILIVLTGLFASNYLGRRILAFGDRVIKGLPIVNTIYSAVRQVVNTFSVSTNRAFQTVVLFEYPRPGCWALGFITTTSLPSARRLTGKNLVNVFIPTTPNPTSGFMLMIPEEDLIPLPVAPDEALKIIATVGLIQKEKAPLPQVLSETPTPAQAKARAKIQARETHKSGKTTRRRPRAETRRRP